ERLSRAAFPVAVVALHIGVDRLPAFDGPLVGLGERLVGRRHAGEHRVAERPAVRVRRNLAGIEERAAAGYLQVAEVRVPEEAGVLRADGPAVLDDVRDDEDLGMARTAAILPDVMLELAKAAAEGDVLLGRELLVAEEDDLVLVQEIDDLPEYVLRQLAGEVDAEHFGA